MFLFEVSAKQMTGREQDDAGEVVNPETQMRRDCHIFNHATEPERRDVFRVILQVQRRRGGETQDVRERENEDGGGERGEK